jgi:hypothetical protein
VPCRHGRAVGFIVGRTELVGGAVRAARRALLSISSKADSTDKTDKALLNNNLVGLLLGRLVGLAQGRLPCLEG